jgi:hypothetical protein
VKLLSLKDRISINQFVSSAVAEKVSALDTEEYIHNRARRANRDKFIAAMSRIPDVKASAEDET